MVEMSLCETEESLLCVCVSEGGERSLSGCLCRRPGVSVERLPPSPPINPLCVDGYRSVSLHSSFYLSS